MSYEKTETEMKWQAANQGRMKLKVMTPLNGSHLVRNSLTWFCDMEYSYSNKQACSTINKHYLYGNYAVIIR